MKNMGTAIRRKYAVIYSGLVPGWRLEGKGTGMVQIEDRYRIR